MRGMGRAEDAAAPRVAVVMPVLDPGPALREALESVRVQSTGRWELLVVDDGSRVDLSWVAALDPRIRLVCQAHAGVSAARNLGIAEATAEWVAFLDHDDVWAPDKLERQLTALEDSGADLSHTAFRWEFVRAGEAPAFQEARYGRVVTYEALLQGETVCTSSVLVRRSALLDAGGFDPSLARAEDLDLWLRLLRRGARFDVLDAVLVTYRVRPSGASADYADTWRRRRDIVRQHGAAARATGDRVLAAAARRGLRRGNELAASQAVDGARAATGWRRAAHLGRALRYHPPTVAGVVVQQLDRARPGRGRERRRSR